MSTITFSNVSMVFDADGAQVTALRDVSFEVQKHEFFVVVGPSGCGKSTLLRLVSGLVAPTFGIIEVFGLKVTRPREDLGFVFQKPNLLPWLSVRDNILFPMRHRYGRVDAGDRRRAEQLMELVQLSDFADARPKALSGGMQQRVGIARALIHDPDILLMDEPFSALDALTREELTLELQSICAKTRKTVLFVTHSINEAVQLGRRILVMTPRPGTVGRIIDVDLPEPRPTHVQKVPRFGEVTEELRFALLGR